MARRGRRVLTRADRHFLNAHGSGRFRVGGEGQSWPTGTRLEIQFATWRGRRSSSVFAPLNSHMVVLIFRKFFIIVPFHPITLLTSSTDRKNIDRAALLCAFEDFLFLGLRASVAAFAFDADELAVGRRRCRRCPVVRAVRSGRTSSYRRRAWLRCSCARRGIRAVRTPSSGGFPRRRWTRRSGQGSSPAGLLIVPLHIFQRFPMRYPAQSPMARIRGECDVK